MDPLLERDRKASRTNVSVGMRCYIYDAAHMDLSRVTLMPAHGRIRSTEHS